MPLHDRFMISADLIRRVRRLEIRTSHLVDELLAGQYHSAFKGQGIEFEEVRPYAVTDDVRSIDWKVTARAGTPYVKLYREERELSLSLLVDVSGSMDFGALGARKRDVAAEVAALLAFAALRNNDKIGLMLFSEAVEHIVKPRAGTRHVLRVIRDLIAHQARLQRTNLRSVLDHFNAATKRRSVVFVISDFLANDYESALRVTRRRHDVVPIVVRDRREIALPRCGLLQVRDAESGRTQVIDTFSGRQRHEFARLADAEQQARDDLFRRLRLERMELWAGEEVLPPLRRFLTQRGKRR